MRRQLVRTGAAGCAGAAVWASFPPLGWWWAAPVGVAVLTVVLRGTRGRASLGLGLVAGIGCWLPLLSFLRGFGVDAWLLVVVIESLWWAGTGWATAVVQRRRWWPAGVALVWVTQEFLRDRLPFGGFPWGRLAFGQADGPLLRLAAVGGAPLVTLVVALVGAVLSYLFVDMSSGGRHRPSPAVLATLGVLVLLPLAVPLPTGGQGSAPSAVVAVIQGNVPRLGLGEFAQRRAVTAYHLAETRVLAAAVAAGRAPQPQLVIWPENSSDLDPYQDLTSRELIIEAAAAVHVPIVVGAVLDGPGDHHVRNAAVVWSPDTGPGQVYVKRHLVPFGEYLPFRSALTRLVGRFSQLPNDFVPGTRPGTLPAGPVRLADTICFEIGDDTVVRQAVTGGGRLIALQTNNADYEQIGDSGRGGETAQQLAIARLRAVEHGRAVVVAATSGVSAVISPSGRVVARTPVFRPAYLDLRVPLRDSLTLADRLGTWPERGMAALGLLWIAGCLRRPRRIARHGSPGPSRSGIRTTRSLDLESTSQPMTG